MTLSLGIGTVFLANQTPADYQPKPKNGFL
jgi:hypothetical protein